MGHGVLCRLSRGRWCADRWWPPLRPVERAGRPSLRARVGLVDAEVHPDRYQPDRDRP